ncbi:MAG: hypothetical protein M3Z16_12525 [Pseudomonadota bacterium]|nr:hypothetical protein [Pseudomonadota bacterium]
MSHVLPRLVAFVLPFACALAATPAIAVEVYGGIATTGFELGASQNLDGLFVGRLEGNFLSYRRDFKTSDIDYDAKLKLANAGGFVDLFFGGGFRLTGGALVGSRKFSGTAKSLSGTIKVNGVVYPVTPADTLAFEAKFPSVSPYLGIGYGHLQSAPGWHFYADAGVAFGRPKVTLSPSASLAAKVTSANILAEQQSAQDKADDYRYYPVLKLGVRYAF